MSETELREALRQISEVAAAAQLRGNRGKCLDALEKIAALAAISAEPEQADWAERFKRLLAEADELGLAGELWKSGGGVVRSIGGYHSPSGSDD